MSYKLPIHTVVPREEIPLEPSFITIRAGGSVVGGGDEVFYARAAFSTMGHQLLIAAANDFIQEVEKKSWPWRWRAGALEAAARVGVCNVEMNTLGSSPAAQERRLHGLMGALAKDPDLVSEIQDIIARRKHPRGTAIAILRHLASRGLLP